MSTPSLLFARDQQLADANTVQDNWLWLAPQDLRNFGWAEEKRGLQHLSDVWWGQSHKTIDDVLSLQDFPRHAFPGGPTSIIIRQCYVDMFDFIWKCGVEGEGTGGILITGQPGTGKTMFQPYLLVRLLQLKQNVLFSMDGKNITLFYFGQVYKTTMTHDLELPIPGSSASVFLWSLFDLRGHEEPSLDFICDGCFPIQTTSPDPSRYKQWRKERSPYIRGFPLWTREELRKALDFQARLPRLNEALALFYKGSRDDSILARYPGTRILLEDWSSDEAAAPCVDVSMPLASLSLEYLLDTAIEHFGRAPRDVYNGVFAFKEMVKQHNLRNFDLGELQRLASSLSRREILGSELPEASHHIFALSTEFGVHWHIEFKSTWVAKQFMDLLADADDSEIRRQITFYRNIPRMISVAGYLFEPLIHRMLANTATGDPWALHTMSSANDNLTVRLTPNDVPDDVQFVKVQRGRRRFHDLPEIFESGCYYWPYAGNFPSFDAFTIEINGTSALLWIILITTSRCAHEGSSTGYQKVRQIVKKLKMQMRTDQPPPAKVKKGVSGGSASVPSVEVRYLLVVPKGGSMNLQWTFPTGWMQNYQRDDHRGDIYCLEVPLAVNDIAEPLPRPGSS